MARKRHTAEEIKVEHTTSIYSGILRMLDLALGIEGAAAHHFFLVAPDNRQGEVRTQFWPTCVLPRV